VASTPAELIGPRRSQLKVCPSVRIAATLGTSQGGETAVSDEEPLTIDIRDGYQPPWLEGTDLACGDYASDIPGAVGLGSGDR
jgi:hypothetical protein